MKIAILSGGAHYTIGGIESYNANLISLLNKDHDVKEFSLFPERKKVRKELTPVEFLQKNNSYFSEIKSLRKNKKVVNSLSQDFDLVIISGGHWVYDYNLENVIFIQHFRNDYYKYKGIGLDLKIKYRVDSLLSFTKIKPNPIINSKNIVYFHEESFNDKSRSDQKKFTSPTSMLESSFSEGGNSFIYIGRIENRQKNVLNIAKNDDGKIIYYGQGERSKKLKKIVGSRFKGILPNGEVVNVLKQSKALILLSKFEGMPIVIAEAASVGTPSIILDTYEMAKFYKEKNIATVLENVEQIKDIDNIELPNRKSVLHSFEKELSKEKFRTSWYKIINHFKKAI